MADTTYQYIDSTGVVVPDTSTLLSTVQQEYLAAFGQDLVLTPDTPQGVLMAAEALARAEVVNNNAALANQINPNVAGGVFLDAIMALTGIQRTPATQTVVSGVTLTGVPGTTVPAGTQVQTAAADIFSSLSTVTIGSGGSITVNFASNAFGPIPCAMSALNMIVTNVLGLETVSNPVAGVLGQNTQSDIQARALRENTLGFQGVALPVAGISALYNVAGVLSLTYQENTQNTTQTINGISMVAHSIYACVDGGADLDVAAAILENKSGGCAMNGGTTVNIIEPASGQSYAVKFDRPTTVPIGVHVTVKNVSGLTDPTDAVKNALLDFVVGAQPGSPGFVVGASVSCFELAGAIYSEQPGLFVTLVEIATPASGSYSTTGISIAVNEKATLLVTDILVTVT